MTTTIYSLSVARGTPGFLPYAERVAAERAQAAALRREFARPAVNGAAVARIALALTVAAFGAVIVAAALGLLA